jgi:hypothetical protein
MNHELLSLIRETGYLTDADLNAQARYDLLTRSFWQKAAELGYIVATFKRKLWRAAGLPEEEPRVLGERLRKHLPGGAPPPGSR